MKTLSLVGIACLCFVLAGCLQTMPVSQPLIFQATVDAYAKPNALANSKYVLVPGEKGVAVSDLQFAEFSKQIEKIFTKLNLKRVTSLDEADVIIFLSYGIGSPQIQQRTYSEPTWGQTGVLASHSSGNVSSYGGMATYSGTTTYIPTYGVTGYTNRIENQVTYTRYLVLDAYDTRLYKREKKMDQVWKVEAISTGSSSDLRQVFPYMAVATTKHIGQNPGHQILEEVYDTDPRVVQLRMN